MHATCLRRPSEPSCRMTSPHLQKPLSLPSALGRPRYPRPNTRCQTQPVFEPRCLFPRALEWPAEMSSSSRIRPLLLRRILRRPSPCPMDQVSLSTLTPSTWTSISRCKCCHFLSLLSFSLFPIYSEFRPEARCYRCKFTSPKCAGSPTLFGVCCWSLYDAVVLSKPSILPEDLRCFVEGLILFLLLSLTLASCCSGGLHHTRQHILRNSNKPDQTDATNSAAQPRHR